MKRALPVLAAALAVILPGGAVAAAVFFAWRRAVEKSLTESLAARLPGRLGRWAAALATGAAATSPLGFPGGVEAWATLGAAVMDRESRGADSSYYSPRGAWDGEGDGGHAVTPWQIDKRYHADYLARTDRTPARDSVYAFGILRDNYKRWHSVPATLAAYNASAKRVAVVVEAARAEGREPTAEDLDPLTTAGPSGGPDYVSDTLSRAEVFA